MFSSGHFLRVILHKASHLGQISNKKEGCPIHIERMCTRRTTIGVYLGHNHLWHPYGMELLQGMITWGSISVIKQKYQDSDPYQLQKPNHVKLFKKKLIWDALNVIRLFGMVWSLSFRSFYHSKKFRNKKDGKE